MSVTEIDGPGDSTEANWLLLHSLPIDSIANVRQIIDLYVTRWPIKAFSRVFKSGCRIEDIQLQTKERLIKTLMFDKVIAWRIMLVTCLGREYPELPCDVVFSEAEWKSVWKVVAEEDPPEEAPDLGRSFPSWPHWG